MPTNDISKEIKASLFAFPVDLVCCSLGWASWPLFQQEASKSSSAQCSLLVFL